ncbi:MAG: hypothetical protein ACRCU5_11060 [Rhizobiaceae bacterium]
MKRLTILTISLLALAACTPKPQVTVVKPNSQAAAIATLQLVNAKAYECWAKDKAFKAYGIIPELDTTGTPRILLVPKGKPQSLPKLVITANRGTIQTFGPLATGPLAPRIQSDVTRWASGATGCNATA